MIPFSEEENVFSTAIAAASLRKESRSSLEATASRGAGKGNPPAASCECVKPSRKISQTKRIRSAAPRAAYTASPSKSRVKPKRARKRSAYGSPLRGALRPGKSRPKTALIQSPAKSLGAAKKGIRPPCPQSAFPKSRGKRPKALTLHQEKQGDGRKMIALSETVPNMGERQRPRTAIHRSKSHDALAKQLRPSTAAPASPATFVSADDRTEPGARRLRSRPKTAMARTPSQQVRRSASHGGLVRPHTAVPSSQRKGGKRVDVTRPTTATLRKQLIRDGQWPSGRWKYRHHHHHSHFPKRGSSAKSGSTVSSLTTTMETLSMTMINPFHLRRIQTRPQRN